MQFRARLRRLMTLTCVAAGLLTATAAEAGSNDPTLIVRSSGPGLVRSEDGAISCRGQCTAAIAVGSLVTLVAHPDGTANHLSAWSGACDGAATMCTLVMTESTEVRAVFLPGQAPPPELTDQPAIVEVGVGGDGLVRSDPPGVECPPRCFDTFGTDEPLTLTAEASDDRAFAGWSAPCGRAHTCTFTPSGEPYVTATFRRRNEVTVRTSGGGRVATDTPPLTARCEGVCAASLPSDATVGLQAAPKRARRFVAWTGACTGSAPLCALATDEAKDTTARFGAGGQPPAQLRVTASGGGRVAATDGRIDCGLRCSSGLADDDLVQLQAVPEDGFAFAGWRGACTGEDECVLTGGRRRSVSATFRRLFRLHVTREEGELAEGTVTSRPLGIFCPPACSATFRSDAVVELEARGYSQHEVVVVDGPLHGLFSAWRGACAGTTDVSHSVVGRCAVAVDADTSAVAVFRSPVFGFVSYGVNVTVSGPGRVTSSPRGINCRFECSRTATGKIRLRAHTDPGSYFVGWSGACTGRDSLCTIAFPGPRVAATFARCALRVSGVSARASGRSAVVSLRTSEPGSARIVVRRAGREVARLERALVANLVTLRTAIPRRAGKGRFEVAVRVTDRCGEVQHQSTRRINVSR